MFRKLLDKLESARVRRLTTKPIRECLSKATRALDQVNSELSALFAQKGDLDIRVKKLLAVKESLKVEIASWKEKLEVLTRDT